MTEKALLNDEDVGNLVREALQDADVASVLRKDPRLAEAYVAQQKVYSQASDFVSEEAKRDHESLYKGYVETLSRVSLEVDSADKELANPRSSVYRSAKLNEIYNHNATYLHELFFANCFDPNSELFQDSLSFIRLQQAWGTFDAWMRDFMACAMSARNGWAVCGYSTFLKRVVNITIDGHDGSVMLGLVPLIVVDMNEHAFVRDYGNDRKRYLTAMMREFAWEIIEERFTKADQIAKAIR